MGHIQQGQKDDLLRHFGLRLPRDPIGRILRQLRGHLGDRRPGLRAAGRKGSVLPHQPQVDNEEHPERTFLLTKCEFSFPSEISVGAKLFIKKALQKNPDNRFNIDYLIKDRFLANAPKYD